MNTHPPATSSNANHNQQGEKRKRDGEQPQPLPPNLNPEPQSASATRQRIVEILSTTANGCLSELGYYPGMPMRMKELETQNITWRDENVKLFEDNQRLLNTVKSLNATLALTTLPESAHFQRAMDLEGEVRRLQAENERIRKLVEVPETLQSEYAKLVESQRMMRNSFMSIREENRRLSEQLHAFIHAQPAQPALQRDPERQPQTIPASYNSQRSGPPLPHIQTQSVASLQGQRPFSSSPGSVSIPHFSNHPEQRNQLMQTQTAVLQNRQQSHSNPTSRRSSLNLVSPSLHPYQQVHVQTNDPAMQFSSGPQIHSPREQQHVHPGPTHMQQNTRRASFPIVYRNENPYPYAQGSQPNSPMVSYGSAEPPPNSATTVSSIQSRRTETPPTPLNASHILSQQSQFAAPVSSDPSATPAFQQFENNAQPMATAISPQDTYIRPPDVSQSQPISSAVIPPQPLPSVATPPQQTIPIQNAQQIPNAPSVGPFSSSVVQQMDPSTSSVSSSLNSFTDQNAPEDTSISTDTQNQTDAMEIDASEDEQEDEQESDIGPDGLRLLQICLEDLFGEPDDDGRLTCKLCLHRYHQNIQEDVPATFVNATDEELVAHAIAEHKHAWEHLRQPEAEGQETKDEEQS